MSNPNRFGGSGNISRDPENPTFDYGSRAMKIRQSKEEQATTNRLIAHLDEKGRKGILNATVIGDWVLYCADPFAHWHVDRHIEGLPIPEALQGKFLSIYAFEKQLSIYLSKRDLENESKKDSTAI